MAQNALALQCLFHLGAGGGEFVALCDKGEHDGQRAALGRADERLKLHPHHPRLVQPNPDRAPAHRRVRLVIGLHIGQHLVRADIKRAEHHALLACGIHHPRIEL